MLPYVRRQRSQQCADVPPQSLEAGVAFARGFVHVERAADLHLQAVAVMRRLADPRDQLHAFVGVVARDAVPAGAQLALDQVNVGGDIVRESFLIILAGIVFALALAFGLGGKDAAAELIDRWWPRTGKKDDD